MSHPVIHSAYLFFLFLIGAEAFLIRFKTRSTFSWQESLTSLGVAVGYKLTQIIFSIIPVTAYTWVWHHRLFTLPLNQIGSMLLLFLGIEFCYYWYHRMAHQVRWLWATHAVHHSAQHFNLSAAYRLGWTGWLSGNFLFFLPLAGLGFSPTAIALGFSLNLMYQFWIHTELIPDLGILEWILNTPAHHRVHHATHPDCIDRNYGGVLIIFDRLFGTFATAPRDQRLHYGLTHPVRSYNPVTIALHEWRRLGRDVVRAQSWGDRILVVLGRPR